MVQVVAAGMIILVVLVETMEIMVAQVVHQEEDIHTQVVVGVVLQQ